MEVAVNKDEMLPPDAASWLGLLQLDRYSPVSCSPFQTALSPTFQRVSFLSRQTLSRLAICISVASVVAGFVWIAGENLSFPSFKETVGIPIQKTTSIPPVIPTLAAHSSTTVGFIVPPPPPLPDTKSFIEETPASPSLSPVTKKKIEQVNKPRLPPVITVTAPASYAGALDAAVARVNANAASTDKPSIRVRRVNSRDLTPQPIKEEVIHE